MDIHNKSTLEITGNSGLNKGEHSKVNSVKPKCVECLAPNQLRGFPAKPVGQQVRREHPIANLALRSCSLNEWGNAIPANSPATSTTQYVSLALAWV
jgi:hypothetical protein